MNNYPDHETYKALYKRFYDGREPGELIELAGSLENKIVLDLCAGDGRLSLEAAKRGAKKIIMVEKEQNMMSVAAWSCAKTETFYCSVQTWLTMFANDAASFDHVFCQQGVNYWLNEINAKSVACVLKKDGLFVFNTFNKKPPEKPLVKEYELDGKKFAEASWLVSNTVHHVQIREGMPPHITSFQWLSPEYLEKILSLHFSIKVINDGASALYRCSRK